MVDTFMVSRHLPTGRKEITKMIATLELFQNRELSMDHDRLSALIYGRAEPIAQIKGLQSKIWFNNPTLGTIGAFIVWQDREALDGFRRAEDTSSIAERWGTVPQINDFDICQSVIDGQIRRFK
jgi:hypothetical protein